MTGNIQISTKLNDGTIIVIGGDDYQTFTTNLYALIPVEDDAKAVLDAFSNLVPTAAGSYSPQAQQYATQNLQQGGVMPPPNVPSVPPGTPVAQQYGQPQQGGGDVPVCAHGARTRREGTYKSGARTGQGYVAYFCSAAKGDPNQCKPIFS